MIRSEEELEDELSRPCPQDEAALREMEGDLLILGVGGKMGPSLARRAARAAVAAGVRKSIIGVARFSNAGAEQRLRACGVETYRADLLEDDQLARLPEAENVIFMAGRKFGSTGEKVSPGRSIPICPPKLLSDTVSRASLCSRAVMSIR